MKIFLIGFMGSGKSHWGKIWAHHTGYAFYDLDTVIEMQQHRSIATVFDQEGEVFFRNLETIALHTFADKDNCIVACGGGAACFNNNMQWMNDNGITVYIAASPSYILNRVAAEKEKRPLINKLNEAELLFFIEQKLKERDPFYKKAKLTLQAAELHAASLAELNFKI